MFDNCSSTEERSPDFRDKVINLERASAQDAAESPAFPILMIT
jgi:hypothetical protein